MEYLLLIRRASPVLLLALFWCWESWRPFVGHRARMGHALPNLAVALFNTLALGLAFGSLTTMAATWMESNGVGLLNLIALPWPVRFASGLLLLDGWRSLWHRPNHPIPFL